MRQYNRDTKVKPFTTPIDADDAYKLSHAPQFKSAKQYIQAKLAMLKNDFLIKEEKMEMAEAHLDAIKRESEIKGWSAIQTEEAINRAVRQIIINN